MGVTTAVTQPLDGAFYKFQMDNGYQLWASQGEQFFDKQTEKFHQIPWRPRPPSMLTPEQKRNVVKNLRKYERKFERADREKKKFRELAALEGKWKERASFRARMDERRKALSQIKEERIRRRGGYDEDDDSNYIIETTMIEEIIEEREEIMRTSL